MLDTAAAMSLLRSLPRHTHTLSQPLTNPTQPHTGPNPINPTCWTQLGITDYVTKWSSTNSSKCLPGQSFAQCFLGGVELGDNDCIGITSSTCPPPSWSSFQSQKFTVEDFYVAYNIYSLWEFFNSYYTAIGNARSSATDNVAAIVSLLDPPKPTNGGLNDILTALSIGLSFLAPSVGPLIGTVLNGAQQAIAVGKYLFPLGTLDSQFAQFSDISESMETVTSYLQHNVSSALAAIQQDATSFLAFTSSGNFSITPLPTIPAQSDALLLALNTYVISRCLTANKWVIARAIDTDVNAIVNNGSDPNWQLPGCGTGYDGNGLCGAYYFNQAIDVSFTLTSNQNPSLDPTPDLQAFFGNWTTPDLLFNGAAQCQVQGGATDPSVSVSSAGVAASCLSSVKVCTWDLNPAHIGTQYEFLDCPLSPGFAVDGCKGCPDGDLCVNVPYSYIGNYLFFQGESPYEYCYKDGDIVQG